MGNISDAHFFLPPDNYEIFRFGGETVKDEKYGIETMMKYFQESGLTEERLRQNSQKYNLNRMFQLVKDYFEREYGYRGEKIELSNRYQHSINSYIFIDGERDQFVHVDELFESSMMSFFLVIFKWSKEFESIDIYGECFKYLLFIMNDVSILGDIPGAVSNEALLQITYGDVQIMNLASSCYWMVVVFSLAHEVGHSYFANITKMLIQQIKQNNPEHMEYIERLLVQSYEDMSKSVIEFGFKIPTFEDVRKEFHLALQQGVKISVINAKDDINKYLNEDTGELRLRTPFSIFVGGQVLDRGITIPNMVGFYYGRNPKTMQQDTVMQHSRMFGYRGSELLAVTRFYTTRKIYESMVKITEIDVALRDDIENERFEDGLCFIERKGDTPTTAKIVPCSPSKISVSNVVYLKPSSRILPVGFLPKTKALSDKIVKNVNIIIDEIMPRGQKGASIINIELAERLIDEVYSCLTPDEDTDRFVASDKMISILRYLSKQSGKCNIIVRRNRNMTKYTKDGIRYIDSPDNGQDERRLAREIAIDMPCLVLLHQTGEDKCWKGREFWWPLLTVPQNAPKTIYALPDIGGRVRRR